MDQLIKLTDFETNLAHEASSLILREVKHEDTIAQMISELVTLPH